MPEPVIEVRDCWKTYGEGSARVHAVCGVSLSVAPAEFIAIRGPSGCGKSTLLNLMGALDVPSQGSVTVGGKNLAALSDVGRSRIRRTDVATIFQSFNLLPTLRVIENVCLPGHLLRRPVSDVERDALRLLAAVGLENRSLAWPETLSGGEMQRAAVARALMNRPRVVLADEPTGNLDTVNAQRVTDLIAGLCQENGTAVVLVTHSAETAAMASRQLVMRDGRIEPEP